MTIGKTLLDSTLNTMNDGIGTLYNSSSEDFNPGENEGNASGTDLMQSDYDFRYRVFPNDLGMDNLGHYMVININVPTKGIKSLNNGLELRTPAGNFTDKITPLNQVSKLDTLRYSRATANNPYRSRPIISVPRQTRRIAESIALHMPQSGLVYTHNNRYEDISLSGALLYGVGAIASGIWGGGLSSNRTNDYRREIGVGNIGRLTNFATKVGGNPINPAIEILFSNTLQRVFRFEFLLAPRNEQESVIVDQIIRTLKFHASPEINDGPGGLYRGLTWIPPAEFDITFFNKGVENMKLPRINTCVIQQLDVDYNPTGMYATFRNGHSVAIRLMIEFVELEPVSKIRVSQGF